MNSTCEDSIVSDVMRRLGGNMKKMLMKRQRFELLCQRGFKRREAQRVRQIEFVIKKTTHSMAMYIKSLHLES